MNHVSVSFLSRIQNCSGTWNSERTEGLSLRRKKMRFLVAICQFAFIVLLGHVSCESESEKGISHPLDRNNTRIVGGEVAVKNEYPWVVRIQSKGSRGLRCGGTLIGAGLVLTAAHCFTGANVKNFEVVAGAHDMHVQEQERQVKDIARANCHNGYNGDNLQNDICILVLSSDLTLSPAIQVARLAEGNPNISDFTVVTGWGKTESVSDSNVLRKVQVPIVSNAICQEAYKSAVNITATMMCAGIGGKDSCQGDSGGGLIGFERNTNQTLVCGIVSFGHGCGVSGYPGVYTRVSSFRQWIADNSGNFPSFFPKTQTIAFILLIKWVL